MTVQFVVDNVKSIRLSSFPYPGGYLSLEVTNVYVCVYLHTCEQHFHKAHIHGQWNELYSNCLHTYFKEKSCDKHTNIHMYHSQRHGPSRAELQALRDGEKRPFVEWKDFKLIETLNKNQ